MGISSDGKKISAPVNWGEPYNVVNQAPSNWKDAGVMCTLANIDKWSLKKPVKYPCLDDNPDRFKAYNGLYGLKAPKIYTSAYALISAIEAGTEKGWEYDPPTGGMESPYRPHDFNGYDHTAKSPLPYIVPGQQFIDEDSIALALDNDAGATSVKLADMTAAQFGDAYGTLNLSQWYVGIYFEETGTNVYTSSTPISIGNGTIHAVAYPWILGQGTHKAYPFLCNFKCTPTDGGVPASGAYFIYAGGAETFSVVAASTLFIPTVTVCKWVNSYSNELQYSVSLKNTSSKNRTFANLRLEISPQRVGGDVATAINFGTVTVNAGQTWSQSGTLDNVDIPTLDGLHSGWTYCRLTYDGRNAKVFTKMPN